MTEQFSPSGADRELLVWSLGEVDYVDGLRLQEVLVDLRKEGKIPDALVFLEHPPVLTLGRGADKTNIVATPTFLEGAGIEVHETGRGGEVTFHGPGQLVGYPIVDLNPDRRDVRRYMRDLEQVIIQALAELGIESGRIDGLTGVWVGSRKIAAMGVRISRWVTSHGFALNVNTALDYFNLIVPCGIRDKGVTSIAEVLGRDIEFSEVEPLILKHFSEVFGRTITPKTIEHESIQVVIGHRHKNKVEYLLLHRVPESGGFWQPVTGTIERKRNETPFEAANREVFEETGFELHITPLDYVHSFMIDPIYQKKGMKSPIFNREHSFTARAPHREVRLAVNEHSEYEWLDYESAKKRLMWRGNHRAFELASRIL